MIQKLTNQQPVGKWDSWSNLEHLVHEHREYKVCTSRKKCAQNEKLSCTTHQGNHGCKQSLFSFVQAHRNILQAFAVPKF